MSSTKDLLTILSSHKQQYSERVKAAEELVSRGGGLWNKLIIWYVSRRLRNVILKNIHSGGVVDSVQYITVECGEAMIVLGKPAVIPLLQILNREKDRSVYMHSQDAIRVTCLVLAKIGDKSALPQLRRFYDYCITNQAGDLFTGPAKMAIRHLEGL